MLSGLLITSVCLAIAGAQEANLQSCVPDGAFDPAVDYFPVKSQHINSDFSISYANSFKTIVNNLTNQTIILYQCGTPRPDIPVGAKAFAIPLSSIGITETPIVTHLEALGLLGSVVASSTSDFVTSPCFQKRVDEIASFNASVGAADVDIVFTSGFSQTDNDNEVRFDVTISVDDESVGARTQWIEFVAAFFNREQEAFRILNEIEDAYECLSEAATIQSTRPNVAWTTFTAPSEFNNNTASWTISKAGYKQEFTRDAGASMILPEQSVFSTVQEFIREIFEADIVIDEGSEAFSSAREFASVYGLNSSDFYFMKQNNVYQLNGRVNPAGGSAWFEEAVLYEHLVLADLISITHPSLLPDHETVILRNVQSEPENVVVTSDSCPGSATAAATIPVTKCPAKIDAGSNLSSDASRVLEGAGFAFSIAMIGLSSLV